MSNLRKAMLLSVIALLLSSSASEARSSKNKKRSRSRNRADRFLPTVPAIIFDEFPFETACLDVSPIVGFGFESEEVANQLYIAVPVAQFNSGQSCGTKIRVSCVEPFEDLGGPSDVCRSKRVLTLTVIDMVRNEELDDDLVVLSPRAFSKLADPQWDSIRVAIHPS